MGLNPVLVLLALLVIALLAFAYYLGRQAARDAESRHHDAVADGIWKAIRDKAFNAKAAETTAVGWHVDALLNEIEQRLGGLLRLAGSVPAKSGLAGHMALLESAKSHVVKLPEPPRPLITPAAPPAPVTPSLGQGETVIAQPTVVSLPGAQGATTYTDGLLIHRISPPAPTPAPAPAPAPPATAVVNPRDQLAKLRLAAEDFFTWWDAKEARISEIKEAQRCLCRKPPAPPRAPVSPRRA